MHAAITSIGTANPPYKQQQLLTAQLITAHLNLSTAERRLLNSVYKATGIEYRHSVLSDYCKKVGEPLDFFPNEAESPYPTTAARMQVYKQHALPLALQAIKECLENHPNIKSHEITHVITVSCTGMYAPGIDIEIVENLKLPTHTKRTCINFMGCYGAFNALKAAEAFCATDPNAKVLIVCVELCTIHFQKSMNLNDIFANAIFADGAGAAIIEHASIAEKGFLLENFYCDLVPDSSREMAWEIVNTGFDIVLSSYVPNLISSGIKEFITKLCKNITNIDLYAIHPGGIKILQACEEVLGITTEDNKHSYQVLKNYGNMSSATILFVLKEFWGNLQDIAGKNIFSCAFGPGLTLESMLLKVK